MTKKYLDAISYILKDQLLKPYNSSEYIDNFIQILIKQLDCFGIMVFKNLQNEELELFHVTPKNFLKHYPALINNLINFLKNNDNENHVLMDHNYYNIFKINNFGYIVINSQDRKYHPWLTHSLTEIIEKFSHIYVQKIDNELMQLNEKQLIRQAKAITNAKIISYITQSFIEKTSNINNYTTQLKINKNYNKLDDKTFDECIEHLYGNCDGITRDIGIFKELTAKQNIKNHFNINYLIEKIENILKHTFSEYNIKLVKNIENIELFTYENELLEALFNIFDNSVEALIVSDEKNKLINVEAVKEKNQIVITIQDNANIIKMEKLNSFFEPFFSTHNSLRSLGLGLYLTKNVIYKLINGTISVSIKEFTYDNILYKGVKFTIKIKE